MENKKRTDLEECIIHYKGNYYLKTDVGYKKIILTDNKDLIKDGVQAIDDEFLEWFVKNPSCESAMVEEKYRKCCRNTDGKNENCIEPINCEGWLSKEYERPYKTTCDKRFEGYKIIIPQQEQDKKMYSEEEVLKAQQAILCNIKDALMNENYIIEYLNNLKPNKL
jgi:hypothetical protein